MLNKKNRISERFLIKQVLEKGATYKNKAFIFKYLESEAKEPAFALTVSLKVSKKAVVRNKLRRQAAEIIRKHLDKLSKSYNVVMIAKSSATEMDYKGLETEIIDFFKKLP